MLAKAIQRVAIVGATGRIGGHITRSLISNGKHNVTVLVRPETDRSKLPAGVQVAPVDFNDESSLVNALRGSQFLIITLSVAVDQALNKIIVNAAAKAGVLNIMPNAFAYPLPRNPDDISPRNIFGKTANIRRSEVESTGTCSSFILGCGYWYEWSLGQGPDALGFDILARKVTMFDDGKRILALSTWNQCGRTVARLLSLPESGPSPSLADYRDGSVPVYSFRVSQRDILDSLHRVLGTTDDDWDISWESSAERVEESGKRLKEGQGSAFAKFLYSNTFVPDSDSADHTKTWTLANKPFNLPIESLDEATERVVEMLHSGWKAFP